MNRLRSGLYLFVMLGGFIAGFAVMLLSGQAALPEGGSIVHNNIVNNFNTQWVPNSDGGILFDGGVEASSGVRTFGTFASFIVDAGNAITIPSNSRLCMNADGGCSRYLTDVGNINVVGANFDVVSGFIRTSTGSIQTGADYRMNNTLGVLLLSAQADSATANAARACSNASWATEGANLMTFENPTNTVKARIRADGSLQFTGQTAASLPTCNAARAGSIQYDTTNNTWRGCNGTTWGTFTVTP